MPNLSRFSVHSLSLPISIPSVSTLTRPRLSSRLVRITRRLRLLRLASLPGATLPAVDHVLCRFTLALHASLVHAFRVRVLALHVRVLRRPALLALEAGGHGDFVPVGVDHARARLVARLETDGPRGLEGFDLRVVEEVACAVAVFDALFSADYFGAVAEWGLRLAALGWLRGDDVGAACRGGGDDFGGGCGGLVAYGGFD